MMRLGIDRSPRPSPKPLMVAERRRPSLKWLSGDLSLPAPTAQRLEPTRMRKLMDGRESGVQGWRARWASCPTRSAAAAGARSRGR